MAKKNQKEQQFHKVRKNAGTTMVELIVSFTLLSLFMVAATKVISNTISVYYQAKGIQTGMQVSNILMTKIVETVEGALPNGTVGDEADAASMIISNSNQRIELIDGFGSHVYLTVDKDYLLLYYFPEISEGESGVDILKDGERWTFDKKAYMGYTVKELKFSVPKGEYPPNVIQVDLTLHSGKYGDYTSKRYIQCYNYNDAALYGKIMVK